jgi:hypothetical protein
MGTATTTYTIIKQGTASPTGFSYSTASVTVAIGNAGKSFKPDISWNNDKGKFNIHSIDTATNSITIDIQTGVISWTSSLASGTYKLTVTASNTMGTVTTTYTFVSKAPDKPSDFYYNPSKVVSHSPKAGESKSPFINWNLDQGTLEINNNRDSENISIDSNTGVIKWNAQLKPKVYTLEVVAKKTLVR